MILCLGTTPTVQRSMTFAHLAPGEVNRAVEVAEYASGKSPNVARVLKTLGADPLAVGFAGGDRGRFLVADLEHAGIRCDFVAILAQTRLCTTVIDAGAASATELVEEHASVDAPEWEALALRLVALLPQAAIWVFSGSLPPKAPQDFYARWVPLARERRATLILDTRGQPLEEALPLGGFIAKLNRDELSATLGRPLDTRASLIEATRTAAPQDGAAIITLGADGAIASDGQRVWEVHSPRVKAVSAVGSGDAFAAGLALGLSRGEALPRAMALGAACGAANAMTSRAGHVNAFDVDQLLPRAEVTEIG